MHYAMQRTAVRTAGAISSIVLIDCLQILIVGLSPALEKSCGSPRGQNLFLGVIILGIKMEKRLAMSSHLPTVGTRNQRLIMSERVTSVKPTSSTVAGSEGYTFYDCHHPTIQPL
jgi:hypothetical protein